MDKRIIKFIKSHHILTLATVKNSLPHTSSIFYAFDEKTYSVYIASAVETRHICDGLANPNVAVNIALDTKVIGKIRGVQCEGELYMADEEEYKRVKQVYISRFPYTLVMDLKLWVIRLNHIKFTDNRLGFGKKICWTRE